MSKVTEQLITETGDIHWVFINGSTKKKSKSSDVLIYAAEVHFHKDSDELKIVKAKIETFWKENKPKGIKLKSNGIRTVQEKTEELDEDDAPIYKDTDFVSISFWTGPKFPDGKEKIITVKNARGNEVFLGSKKIGNGSIGRISGVMDIYHVDGSAGVTLYLNAIQLKKFVEFTGADDGFNAMKEEDGNFEGIADDGMEAMSEDKTVEIAKPRL